MGSEVQDRERAGAVVGRQAADDAVARALARRGLRVSCAHPYSARHRATDIRPLDYDGGGTANWPWVCAICHPPPADVELERRATWDERPRDAAGEPV